MFLSLRWLVDIFKNFWNVSLNDCSFFSIMKTSLKKFKILLSTDKISFIYLEDIQESMFFNAM